ncbi:MAG: hypothetical protein MUC48_08150 [Leptolyngbya sp. Prado105]|jgi:hypothetical protein|nr:hypothetical protein [Leptolyngbya sp. Prado105]
MSEFDPIQSDPEQMAVTILRRNALYRLLHRNHPPEIYQTIAQRAERHLSLHLPDLTHYYSPVEMEQQLQRVCLETWQAVLGEPELTALAIHVQQQPTRSLSFQKAIDVLLRAFAVSQRIKKRPDSLSEEAYLEAQNMLQLWICKNIFSFNPARGEFIKWVNYRFDRTFLLEKKQATYQDYRTSDDLDNLPAIDPASFESTLLNWLLEDYIFRIPNRDKPEVTFLDIAVARIQNQSWQAIADRFSFNGLSTPSNFFKTWLKYLTMPLITGRNQSSLYRLRLSRFESESWSTLAAHFEIDEISLKKLHQTRLQQFPSYRDVTRSERYRIEIESASQVTFAEVAKTLLEEGHLWQEPAQRFQIDPTRLKIFYDQTLEALWGQTQFD